MPTRRHTCRIAIDPPRVTVLPVTDDLDAAVRALRVADGQLRFVGDVGQNLDNARRDAGAEPMAVLVDAAVAGFYRIDRLVSVVSRQRRDDGCIALRAFLLDARQQGQGLGAHALLACCDDLRRRHPDARTLALNVHCINAAAIGAYRRAGFVDTGELVPGGAAGLQHLMVRRLGVDPVGH